MRRVASLRSFEPGIWRRGPRESAAVGCNRAARVSRPYREKTAARPELGDLRMGLLRMGVEHLFLWQVPFEGYPFALLTF